MATGQWWVVLQGQSTISQILNRLTNPSGGIPQSATKAAVVQSATKPANYYKGPFPTQAVAQQQANAYNNPNLGNQIEETFNRGPSSGSGASAASWSVVFGNDTGLMGRIFKVVFGGALIVIGVSHMVGADNKLMDLAKQIKVIPV